MNFCETCFDEVEVSIRPIRRNITIKGKYIDYNGKLAYCKECGSKVFNDSAHDYNLKQIDKEYKNITK